VRRLTALDQLCEQGARDREQMGTMSRPVPPALTWLHSLRRDGERACA
jgi:hypothetical protein